MVQVRKPAKDSHDEAQGRADAKKTRLVKGGKGLGGEATSATILLAPLHTVVYLGRRHRDIFLKREKGQQLSTYRGTRLAPTTEKQPFPRSRFPTPASYTARTASFLTGEQRPLVSVNLASGDQNV